MKWKDLKGEERYRVVETARKGQVPIRELCRTFGVSRQALKTAMDKADRGAMDALEPKSPGRKARSMEESQASRVMEENVSLRKELEHWKQKFDVAMTFVELHRKLQRGESLPGEEEDASGKKKRKGSKVNGTDQPTAGMAGNDRGKGDGSET
jgi:transposase-like protein